MRIKNIHLFLLVAFIGITFFSYYALENRKITKKFYCKPFSGKIVKIETNIKGYKNVTLTNGDCVYLGDYFNKTYYNLEIGDSIFKDSGSFIIKFYIDDILVYETPDRKHNFKCK
jgi:hypothetical protein